MNVTLNDKDQVSYKGKDEELFKTIDLGLRFTGLVYLFERVKLVLV